MRKLFAAVLCAAALVGCGPMDENELAASNQDALIQPDGVPGTATLDPAQLQLNATQQQVQAQKDFADQYVWGVTQKPGHCNGGK